MNKVVKDVFKNIRIDNNIADATIKELKFSKKLNSAIVHLTSQKNITLTELSEFEKLAKTAYELQSLKIDYKYTGEIEELKENMIKNILLEISKTAVYTSAILNDVTTEIADNNVIINLKLPYSEFLKLKNIDVLIEKCMYIRYGIKIKIKFNDLVKTEKIENKEHIKTIDIRDLNPNYKQNNFNIIPENNIVTNNESKVILNVNPSNTSESFDNVNSTPNNSYSNKIPYQKRTPKPIFEENAPEHVIIGRDIKDELTDKIVKLSEDYDKTIIEGSIITSEPRKLKSGKYIYSFDVADKTSTITCKMFLTEDDIGKIGKKLKAGGYIKVEGTPQFDTYANELTMMATSINEAKKPSGRKDNAEVKRVELHMHTQMSSMDAVSSAKSIIKQAINWGHKAVAITDHGVVQAFPEAHHVITDNYTKPDENGKWPKTQDVVNNAPIKVLYGVEGYLVQDVEPNFKVPNTYCVFDIETTGFSSKYDKITEIACCKVKDGIIIDEFATFVNPEKAIPKQVQDITHITDDMVKDAPKISEVLPKFLDFIEGSILVAHNAKFDISFIKENVQVEKLEDRFKPIVMDTLMISREIYNHLENHKLGTIAESLGVSLEGAHRAINDTRATVEVMNIMLKHAKEKGINTDGFLYSNIEDDIRNLPLYHVIIFAKDYIGLKNLYKLVSFSHVHYFKKKPRITRSMLNRYKEGLIIGSACEAGELFQAIVEKQDEKQIETIANYYDYLEIQPLGNNEYYTRVGRKNKDRTKENIKLTEDELKQINIDIVNLGEKLNKPVVATCDTHFIEPEDEIYRRIIQAGQGYDDADMQAPLYFRTTDEMLKEFDYLTEEKAYEVVVTNTNLVADMCSPITPISDEKCPPHIEGCEQEIRDIAEQKAIELYGENYPEIVKKRMDKELDSIIKNGFSVMYIIAQKLVWKSNEDGYLVGSRGSVGSSFVAYLTGITEVNSLEAHYRCPDCKHSDFTDYGVKNGVDLPDKECPKCGAKYIKDGMDIPFETFLGFNGDKEPDIDLNFSGEYQATAHKYTEVIFGTGTTYKAGTIGTVADKTAYGFVMKYLEERNQPMRTAHINTISKGCTGIKRTSGQHPGGIIVVPKGREIYEFCPVQHPADDPFSKIITTHFDYHSIDRNLLKLDILGHDDPTVIRMLQDITGVDPTQIPLDDKKTMSIFSSTDALGVTSKQIKSEVGTYGVPEFGTKFVRGMLMDTRPTTFEELIRISGLSHGTDVWLNNAQTLINDGIVTLNEAICTRDDIMIYLIKQGLPPNAAFKIMEPVRKGKGLKPDQEAMMREYNVPEWYIDSCKKIKYMFPKAHAAAYVTMAFRIAWFKVHMPKAYYAAFYSIRADEFESESMLYGKENVLKKMAEIDAQGNSAAPKDKNMYPILEIVLEMYERGINFLPVDLYKSDASKFIVEEDGLRPPLSSMTGFGDVDSKKLVEARENGKFETIEELQLRSKIGKVSLEVLQKNGCLEGMPASSQVSLFEM